MKLSEFRIGETVNLFKCRFIRQSERGVLIQTSVGILRLLSVLSSSNTSRSLVVLFLDFPLCCSCARVLGDHNNSHSYCSFRFREWSYASSQLQQGSRLFPFGQFRIYLSFISGVCDRVEYRSWSKMASMP